MTGTMSVMTDSREPPGAARRYGTDGIPPLIIGSLIIVHDVTESIIRSLRKWSDVRRVKAK